MGKVVVGGISVAVAEGVAAEVVGSVLPSVAVGWAKTETVNNTDKIANAIP